MESTRLTRDIFVDKNCFKEYLRKRFKAELENAFQECAYLYENRADITFTEKGLMYLHSRQIVLPDMTKDKDLTYISIPEDFDPATFGKTYMPQEGYQWVLPEFEELNATKKYAKKYKIFSDARILGISNEILNTYAFDGEKFVTAYYKWGYNDTRHEKIAIPVIRVDSIKTAGDFVDKVILGLRLCPEGVSKEAQVMLKKIFELSAELEKIPTWETVSEILDDLIESEGEGEQFKTLRCSLTEAIRGYYQQRKLEGVTVISSELREKLLNCEYDRAAIEPYEERLLTDPNRGHWDLWTDDMEGFNVQTDRDLVARNPRCDVNEDGVIAIDFGTKSTVVVYQKDIDHSLPMRIGDGELSKKKSARQYENPTVMHFVNLDKFMQAYRNKKGRPDTKWEDLQISHTAVDKFQNSSSNEYYSFLQQIKQWAGMRDKQFRIQTPNGESLILKSFMDIGEDDVNPIELYAYYIGLYINNMRNGIFLDYYLSFPVTYEMAIRNKIIESFRKGLIKSLPEPIQNDSELMARFSVNGNISEPAAYAVCALQEYGFDPKGDEEVFYGIFDFGGGTTDFDFGLWTKSKKKRYDYKIEHFGAGGDKYLGGENLLEMLAFNIFKENQDIMREGGFTFTLAPECTEFAGSDAILADSQEAEKNMHNLMEKLRPMWEKQNADNSLNTRADRTEQSDIDDEWEKKTGKKYITVDLFDKSGTMKPEVRLETSQSFIDQFFEDKIRKGVSNFFSALMLSYQNGRVKKPTKINILLAGNSCRSPIVKWVFEEEIEQLEQRIREKYEVEKTGKFCELFPPLGTEEAYRKMIDKCKNMDLANEMETAAAAEMKDNCQKYINDIYEKPTGKTGVAFGLVQCRTGGNIEGAEECETDSEIPFKYFLGYNTGKKFEIFRDDEKKMALLGRPDLNEWYRYIEADVNTFYLYYTTLPECVDGNLLIEGNAAVKRKKCMIDVTDENAVVYIRANTPHSVQYAVSTGYDVDKNKLGQIFTEELE